MSKYKVDPYNPCKPWNIAKRFRRSIKEGETKEEQTMIARDLFSSCTGGALAGAAVGKKVRGKRKMSNYNCFLRLCAKADNKLGFQDCMKGKFWGKIKEAHGQLFRDLVDKTNCNPTEMPDIVFEIGRQKALSETK